MKINTASEFNWLGQQLQFVYQAELNKVLKKKAPAQLTDLHQLLKKNIQKIIEYGPYSLYLMTSYSKCLALVKTTEKISRSYQGHLSHEQDELFEHWTSSEYSKDFLSFLSKGDPIGVACEKTLQLCIKQLSIFFLLHFQNSIPEKIKREYRPTHEIGDLKLKKQLILGKDIYRNSTKHPYIFIEQESKIAKKQMKRIDSALEIIKTVSPISYKRFCHFTKYIVPINDPGIVSFSSQNIPFFSTVNLYQRDNIDLLDDLLHENGHHHLNSYLNLDTLINEDQELIYYSPWRKALRPIRGIYHAYFTFYWALDLFSNLEHFISKNPDILRFKKSEITKINFRFCEEFLMLNYCWPDLLHGLKQNKINPEGFRLISEIHQKISRKKTQFKKVLQLLPLREKEKIVSLQKLLTNKRKDFYLGID